jgi:hypothetical protein
LPLLSVAGMYGNGVAYVGLKACAERSRQSQLTL